MFVCIDLGNNATCKAIVRKRWFIRQYLHQLSLPIWTLAWDTSLAVVLPIPIQPQFILEITMPCEVLKIISVNTIYEETWGVDAHHDSNFRHGHLMTSRVNLVDTLLCMNLIHGEWMPVMMCKDIQPCVTHPR